jgi:hypothetical protein
VTTIESKIPSVDHFVHAAMLRGLELRLSLAGLDELRVIDRVLQRLELGRERHGELDVSKPISSRRERFEERLDALVYDIAEELALEDAEVARKRAAARTQIAPSSTPVDPT